MHAHRYMSMIIYVCIEYYISIYVCIHMYVHMYKCIHLKIAFSYYIVVRNIPMSLIVNNITQMAI